MGEWFMAPSGLQWLPRSWLDAMLRPKMSGEYVCNRCGQRLIPCDRCGNPALCGDVYCELCQPDG